MNIQDYLIEQEGLDWGKLLEPWHERLPQQFTLWLVNRFGDPFIKLDDGSIWVLRMDEGELKKLAESREHACELVDQESNANDWFLIQLVDALVAGGVTLDHGECYGFAIPPVIGGEYSVSNIRRKQLGEYYSFLADFYDQIKDVPDGRPVSIRIVNTNRSAKDR